MSERNVNSSKEEGEGEQKSRKLRRAYTKILESWPSRSQALLNVESIELNALMITRRLCQSIAEANTFPNSDTHTV